MKAAGLIYGTLWHHVDHLAILCHALQIPLIVTEEEILAIAQKYYPHLEIHYWDYLTVAQNVVSHFDTIFYSVPRPLFDQAFFLAEKLAGKKIRTLWCPHGNSDKGHQSLMMEALSQEEIALVYGQKMIDFLKQKNAFNHLKAHAILGNYRYTYYKENRPFYEQVIHRELPLKKKMILYAPTWKDAEDSSSFETACPMLIKHLPKDYSLVIKPHPNQSIEPIDHPDVYYLTDFPPIYPVLEHASVYIGDMSSIGYDYLVYARPMIFLNQNRRGLHQDQGLYLHRCGLSLTPEEYPRIYDLLEKTDFQKFVPLQKETYEYTFGKEKSFQTLRNEIERII